MWNLIQKWQRGIQFDDRFKIEKHDRWKGGRRQTSIISEKEERSVPSSKRKSINGCPTSPLRPLDIQNHIITESQRHAIGCRQQKETILPSTIAPSCKCSPHHRDFALYGTPYASPSRETGIFRIWTTVGTGSNVFSRPSGCFFDFFEQKRRLVGPQFGAGRSLDRLSLLFLPRIREEPEEVCSMC